MKLTDTEGTNADLGTFKPTDLFGGSLAYTDDPRYDNAATDRGDGEVADDDVAETRIAVDEPKTDEPKADEPAAEEPKADEPAAEESKADEPKADEHEPGSMIPRSRLNKEIEKRRQLEQQLREATASAKVKPVEVAKPEIDKARFAEFFNAGLEGRTDDALSIFAELMQTTGQGIATSVASAAPNMVVETLEQREINAELGAVAGEMVTEYAALDDSGDAFDQDALDEVCAVRDSLIAARGLRPADALRRAAKMVMADRGYAPRASAQSAPAAPAPATPRPIDVARKTELAAAQPPSPSVPGTNRASVKAALDVHSMTDAEYDSLDAQSRARLRGDIVD